MVDTVVSRGEFLTSYTPYQAEIAQGTLTTIFEFQTMLCQLTGMEVANASMYDGSSAVPEAAMMAVRVTGRDGVLVSKTVHPEYREVLRTYSQHQGMPVEDFGYVDGSGALDLADLESKISNDTAAVVIVRPRTSSASSRTSRRPPSWRTSTARCWWWRSRKLYRSDCLSRLARPISSPENCNRSRSLPATAARMPE